jgi:hypothetical protein
MQFRRDKSRIVSEPGDVRKVGPALRSTAASRTEATSNAGGWIEAVGDGDCARQVKLAKMIRHCEVVFIFRPISIGTVRLRL